MFAEHQYRIFYRRFLVSHGDTLYAMLFIERHRTAVHHIPQIGQCRLRKSMIGLFPHCQFLTIVYPTGSYQLICCLPTEVRQHGSRQKPVFCKRYFYLFRFERCIPQFGKLCFQILRLWRTCQFLFAGKAQRDAVVIFIGQRQREAELIIGKQYAYSNLPFSRLP